MVLQEQWFVCFAIWYVLRVIQSRTKKIPRHVKTVCALNSVHLFSTYSSGGLLTDHLGSSQECPCHMAPS